MSLLPEYCQDLYVLNEAYYGKPKEFIEIEKRLEKIIDMIKLTKINPEKAININDMRELYEIEQIFTKFFGNSETEISFYIPVADTINTGLKITGVTAPKSVQTILKIINTPGYNAFTIPSSLSYFRKSKTNKKLVDPKDLYINVFIDIGLVYGLDLSAQELMGLILHEIGHDFDASFFTLLSHIDFKLVDTFMLSNGKLSNIQYNSSDTIFNELLGSLYGYILSSLPIAKFYTLMTRLMTYNPVINDIVTSFNLFISDVWSLMDNYRAYKNIILTLKNPVIIAMRLLNPKNTFGYSSEKFADSFATSYGYGKDIASFTNKCRINKGKFISENISKVPILNFGYDLNKVMVEIATSLTNPHPDHAIIIQSQLNKLKRDLNDPNLPPKLKQELVENIKDLEDYIDNVVLNINDDSNKGRLISYIKNFIMIKIFKGKLDPRELFEIVWDHEL